MDQSIRGYLGNLEQQGKRVRFAKEVDPQNNLTAAGWKTYGQFGKASLFDNPAATDPAARERFEMAMPKNYHSIDLNDFLPN